VVLPRRWSFWTRDPVDAAGAQPIGRARFTALRFVTPTAESFTPPPGARTE